MARGIGCPCLDRQRSSRSRSVRSDGRARSGIGLSGSALETQIAVSECDWRRKQCVEGVATAAGHHSQQLSHGRVNHWRKLQLCQVLLRGSSNASKLFIFKVNYLTWKGNPLKSTAEKVRSAWIGGDVNSMTGVRVRENESIESAIRRFKKLCEKAGILAELRKREHYEKPSVKKKKKAIAAKKRAMRRVRHSF